MPVWATLILVYGLWAAFGFLFGSHWIALLCAVAATRGERIVCGLHLGLYWVALIMLASGGCAHPLSLTCPWYAFLGLPD